ncbi:DNA-processing protein DprA [Roseovarius nubinhibens]|uniref:DNA-processing protein DprA n=1 Tax=Roseovarius nubinhibens TaxID=314263 RepID=UPI001C08A148|nr:DNA-processing protein DprA [Roseovarius nubinhibens]MBU2999676.1 DNA-processing protein DprA [Roseovarius nubinhibens]
MAVDIHPSTHPPLPPTTEDARLSWLRLLRSRRVGITTFYRLLAKFGTAENALAALPDIARAAGVTDYIPCPEGVAHIEMRNAARHKARFIAITDADYPAALRDIPDPPPFLWVTGDISVLSRPMIALVGARNASSLGMRMSRALASDLGRAGYVVVSGLARGIDTAAHRAALDSGTIAVMAGGVDVIYPVENDRLAVDLLAHGLRLSENAMGIAPQARHFPQRNRLISGLARAVVVVEAAAKSGSLLTARNALDQGREVLAVPGHPFDARAAGCNMLIRDGARLVRDARDVLELLTEEDARAATPEPPTPEPPTPDPTVAPDIPAPPPERRSLRDTAQLHSQILNRLGPSPLPEDQLIRDMGLGANAVAPALVDLELAGRIQRQAGGLLSRNS